MSAKIKKALPVVLSVWIAFVFIQSLFFKFAGAPETQHIFSTLDVWFAGLTGIDNVFINGGIFNAYFIGTAELVASVLLLGAIVLRSPIMSLAGAVLTLGIISGAVFFHLATPLGVNVNGDGGALFIMACTVLVSSLVLIAVRWGQVKQPTHMVAAPSMA